MSERRAGRSIVGTLLLAIACGLLFLLPSAWLVHQGHSRWLALGLGLAAFPVVPVLWHLLGERARRRGGAKGTLMPSDRFVMRLVAVALVAIGPLLLFSRGPTWAALKKHPTWFLHWGGGDGGWGGSAGPISGDSRMLSYVPEDAEFILWIRNIDRMVERIAKGIGGQVEEDPEGMREALIAIRKDRLLMVIRGGDDRKSIAVKEDDRRKLVETGLMGDPGQLITSDPTGDIRLLLSQSWEADVRARAAGTAAAPARLVALLERAPDDAVVIAAITPREPIAGMALQEGTGWVRIGDDLRIEADILAGSPTVAAMVRTAIRAKVAEDDPRMPASCRDEVERLRRGIDVDGEGEQVKIEAVISGDALVDLVLCGFGGGGDGGGEQD